MTAECFRCGAPAETRFGDGYLCDDCQPDETTTEEPDSPDATPRGDGDNTASSEDELSGYKAIFTRAQEIGARESWEYVAQNELRQALVEAGHQNLLDNGELARLDDWQRVDLADEGAEDSEWAWYYASGEEPRPDEFRRFHELLTANAPDDYTPYYFRVEPAGKAPATKFGSWKDASNRLTVDEAVEWMEEGGNVGIAGTPDDSLVNIDIDDGEETTAEDIPDTLRARSRSRGGWHAWGFNPEDDIPNLPTDDLGEVRTDWQYVVAPGSFVASAAFEIPDDTDNAGYYTIEHEAPVAEIEYDDLPEAFREWEEERDEDAPPQDSDDADDLVGNGAAADGDGTTNYSKSAVFEVTAEDVARSEGGSTDTDDRWTAMFHGSSTSANMSVSDEGKLQCWRHNVAHGGLQALAALSDKSPSSACRKIGTGHQRSGVGGCQYEGDWRLIWWAWEYAKKAGEIPDDDPIPHRALVNIAVRDGIVSRDELVERESEDGGTYAGFPHAEAYNAALAHVENEYGRDPGRDPITSGQTDAETDPEELKALDVTLDPEVAWRAADAVSPSEVGGDLAVPTTEDESAWRCPRCEGEIGVVRAAAIDANIVTHCSAPLRDDGYDRAYEHARRGLDAPLPEYVSRETATERWDVVRGAIRQLEFWHLDEDALESEITGRGNDVDGAAELTLDPAWRDSDSGESVLVFPSGTVYDAHPDHEDSLDALRFVGLDAGLIDWSEFTSDEYQLEGATFRAVYNAARDYGAPLPRWEGTDAYHTAVLPPADELVDEDVGDDDRLAAAYDAVGDLYTDAAEAEDASLLRVLPGLGKTEQVFRNATDYPVLYTAGRKELMQDGVARAEANDATAYILPVFAENGPPTVITDTAEAVVREQGQRLLRDRWSLVERVRERLPDDECLQKPEEYDGADDESVSLDRESCPTADGEHGLDWWVAVHAARARGYRPQQIHENAAALFGADLPCTCGDDEDPTCAYTDAWETATDPDDPFDVLIGHYTHAHVEGARTYAARENNRVEETPRVVAVDEFPGEAYQREFGDEFPDLAAWLARSLHDDVDDRQDLLTKAEALWADDTVRAWLADDGASDEHGRLAGVLSTAQAGLDALETAEWLLEERHDACSDLGVADALQRLVDAHPDLDAGTTATVTAALTNAVSADENRGQHTRTLNILSDLVDDLREIRLAGDSLEADLADALADATHVDGTLASLVSDAIDSYRERAESARRQLDAAITALQGGPDGCEALAMHADDGYAHPLAHALLYALLAPADDTDVATVRTSNFTFGREEDTRLSSVGYRKSRVVLDRNHHGAVVNHPPAFTAGGGTNPAVGLDATGRATLWELAFGRDVTTRDIHDDARERREFLRDVYGLQLVQTSPHANSYEGDPSGKNFDDDVELVAEVGREYGDTVGQQPAVLTTKVVEDTLEERLDGLASATDHYGNLKGSNALADHRLAVLLGCQHYGDHVVERWAALAGEEATRTGHGMALDYNSRVANTALQHMREDQVMQAALRFGRDSDGALVFAHTAALRDDLPVVGDGEVVRTFSEQAQAIASAAGELARRPQFTASDVRERVDGFDPAPRTVRRVLGELAEFGYLEKTETPNGHANQFGVTDEPRAAEVELPDLESRAADTDPGRDPLEVYYTWFVRVSPGDPRSSRHRSVDSAQLPAPGGGDSEAGASAPPG